MHQEEADKYGVKLSTIDNIFETCDVISVHLALTPVTTGLINRKLLSKIKQGALFVNTARGAIIVEEDLIEELQNLRFSAVLDVFVKEPLEKESPLRTLPNVLPIPHIAGPTTDMREAVTLALATDINSYISGQELQNEISYEHALRMTQ